ncbi:hypothetical protein WJX74_002587 [Apatococcus lobatus]|uniref:HPP transmembrane region domain-containing protein n=1 Tax=Apatococcus lobatus TaxID=904363 RepID=A0AAW1PRR7_9CHLO
MDRLAAARAWVDSQATTSPQPSPHSTPSSERITSSAGHSPLTSLQSSPANTSSCKHPAAEQQLPSDQLLTTSSIYNYLLQTELGDMQTQRRLGLADIELAESSAASPEPKSDSHSQARSASLHGWLGPGQTRARPSLRATIAQAGWAPRQSSISSSLQSSPARNPESSESSVKQSLPQITGRKSSNPYPSHILSSTSSVKRLLGEGPEETSVGPQLEDLREASFTAAISEPCTFDSAGEVPDSARRTSGAAPSPKLPDSDALVFTVHDGELVPDLPKKVAKFSVETAVVPSQVSRSHSQPSFKQPLPHPATQKGSPDLEAQTTEQGCCSGQGCCWGLGTCLWTRLSGLAGAGQQPPARTPFLQVCANFAGALLSLMLAAGIAIWMAPALSLPLLLGPLGATAATMFGLLDSPPAQPRSVLAGTLLSCLIGAILRVPLGHVLWVCGPLSVAVSIAVMQLSNTLHPPGAGLALSIAMLSPVKTQQLLPDGSHTPWQRIPNVWDLHRTLDAGFGARIVEGLQLTAGAFIGTCIILLLAVAVRCLCGSQTCTSCRWHPVGQDEGRPKSFPLLSLWWRLNPLVSYLLSEQQETTAEAAQLQIMVAA